jgi:hypothetical protein
MHSEKFETIHEARRKEAEKFVFLGTPIISVNALSLLLSNTINLMVSFNFTLNEIESMSLINETGFCSLIHSTFNLSGLSSGEIVQLFGNVSPLIE